MGGIQTEIVSLTVTPDTLQSDEHANTLFWLGPSRKPGSPLYVAISLINLILKNCPLSLLCGLIGSDMWFWLWIQTESLCCKSVLSSFRVKVKNFTPLVIYHCSNQTESKFPKQKRIHQQQKGGVCCLIYITLAELWNWMVTCWIMKLIFFISVGLTKFHTLRSPLIRFFQSWFTTQPFYLIVQFRNWWFLKLSRSTLLF